MLRQLKYILEDQKTESMIARYTTLYGIPEVKFGKTPKGINSRFDDEGENEIKLSKDADDKKIWNAFWHEVGHFILEMAGIGNRYDDEKPMQEGVVQVFSNAVQNGGINPENVGTNKKWLIEFYNKVSGRAKQTPEEITNFKASHEYRDYLDRYNLVTKKYKE